MQTFFQPDEHYQTTEIAHRLVFGYGFKSWEWSSCITPSALSNTSYLTAAVRNLLDGPVRSILHPLLFVPGYTLLRLTGLDQTSLLILFPRLQQALIAAGGRLLHLPTSPPHRRTVVAWLATLVNLSNLYTLFTATRTFSNSTEGCLPQPRSSTGPTCRSSRPILTCLRFPPPRNEIGCGNCKSRMCLAADGTEGYEGRVGSADGVR